MATIDIDIKLKTNAFNITAPIPPIQNGEKLEYKINKNSTGYGYDNLPPLVDKTFLVDSTDTVRNIASFDGFKLETILGEFNGTTLTTEVFEHNGTTYIAVGGNFTTYTKNGNITNCTGFVLLNENGFVVNLSNFDYNNFAETIAGTIIVNVIKYKEITQNLIIGGRFANVGSTSVDHLFEIDMNAEEINQTSLNKFDNEGGFVGNQIYDITIKQNVGATWVVGDIDEWLGDTNNKGMYGFTNAWNGLSLFNGNTSDTPFITGFPTRIEITEGLDSFIKIAGDFTINGSNLNNYFTTFNVLGNAPTFSEQQNFPFNAPVYDFKVVGNDTYAVGEFTQYGQQAVNKIVKFNNTIGFRDTSFDVTFDHDDFFGIDITNDTMYLIFNVNDDSINYAIVDLNNNETITAFFDGSLNSVHSFGDKIYINGAISSFNYNDINLGESIILVNQNSMLTTRNNIYDNLTTYNTINSDLGFSYSKIGTDTVRITKVITDPDDIYTISDILDNDIKYEIILFNNDSNFNQDLNLLMLRKPTIITSESSIDFNKVEFNLTVDDSFQKIIKPRISDNQSKQYLEVNKLITQENFEGDINQFNSLDFSNNDIEIVNTGKSYQFLVESKLSSVLINSISQVGIILDGYRFPNNSLLLNGNKRVFSDDEKLVVPFLTNEVKEVFINGLVTLNNNNFNNIAIFTPENFASYFILNTNLWNENKLDIQFIDGEGNVIDSFMFIRRNNNCLFNPVRVVFKNSSGLLEATYLNANSRESIKTTKSIYERSLIDINGDSIDNNKHKNKVFNKEGERVLECNTDYVPQFMNDCYEDLYMSEEIWIEWNGQTYPVELENSNFNKDQDTDSKLINYRFSFKLDRKITDE